MLKDFAKIVLTAKAAVDVIKDRMSTRATDIAMQIRNFTNKDQNDKNQNGEEEPSSRDTINRVSTGAKEEMSQLLSEIMHRTQINELQLKGYIKDKLTELTNNALLDSQELNDIRAEIAALRAEVADIKEKINITRK